MDYKKKIVYVGLAADILHEGHMNILNFASKYGDVVVGLLTDKAISSYKKFPHLSYRQRLSVLRNIRYVKKVIPQDTLDYTKNLLLTKPNYVVHGDDWKVGVQKKTRADVIKILKKWSGKLIEKKYTENISSSSIKEKVRSFGVTPESRRSKLSRLLNAKTLVRVMESHNPLAGLIVENIMLKDKQIVEEFDCMWSSSLTDSVSRGMPDNQSVDYSTRIHGVNDIFNVTTKPMIFDIDNGGQIEHLPFVIKKLEQAGVSAIIMEDKIGLKKNSLFADQKNVQQDSIKNFCKKIKTVKNTQISDDFFFISRIESLILGKSVNDALKRAIAYSKAGSDCIMIHSKDNNPKSIFEFAKKFKKTKYFKPLVSVPSTYSKTYEKDLIKNGFRIVIYANQLLRGSYNAMVDTSKKILKFKRAHEVEKNICPIKDILVLIKD
jgi:phosphoenolpyruvate phosphomutase / 2-hydroxyethylphosphonate cytidylyltransferase